MSTGSYLERPAPVPGKEGVPPSGWTMHAGPQAWHVILSSRVSVFLMDGEQSYRDNETTSRASIERFAAEFGVDKVEVVNLAGAPAKRPDHRLGRPLPR